MGVCEDGVCVKGFMKRDSVKRGLCVCVGSVKMEAEEEETVKGVC